MLNEHLFLLSIGELKNFIYYNLSVFDIAQTYIILYVVYAVLGHYIYFKPHEHASKINRTFLVLSLLIVTLFYLNDFIGYLPYLPEYQWLFAVCSLVLCVAPLSILMHMLIWKYGAKDNRSLRFSGYVPIRPDYFKTTQQKIEQLGGGRSFNWEEEVVSTTEKNLHSDALLNAFALIIFIVTGFRWSLESFNTFGWYTFIYFIVIYIWVTAVYTDRVIFSWIKYIKDKTKKKH